MVFGMEDIMAELREVLTTSYRKAVHDYFDNREAYPDKNLEKLSPAEQEEELYKMFFQYASERAGVIEQWAKTPLDDLQGSAPEEVIQNLENLEQVLDIFTHMACFADEEVPYLLIEKLKQFGEDAVSALYQLALDNTDGERQSEYLFASSVYALSAIETAECADRLIDLAYHVSGDSQMEQIEASLGKLGSHAVEPLLQRLQNTEIGKVESTLLYALATAGSHAKDDRIYRQLRNAFRTVDDKLPIILCFSAYGDGRAVPMLRSYLEKNADALPDRVFHEVIGVIRGLGGEIDDFMHTHHHHDHSFSS